MEIGMDDIRMYGASKSFRWNIAAIIALYVVVSLSIMALGIFCGGCGATVTVNILSSHSRYGQAIGGTNTMIRGQIEGGGSATGTLTP